MTSSPRRVVLPGTPRGVLNQKSPFARPATPSPRRAAGASAAAASAAPEIEISVGGDGDFDGDSSGDSAVRVLDLDGAAAGPGRYACRQCAYRSDSRAALQFHAEAHRDLGRRLRCREDGCPFQTGNLAEMERHMERHEGEKVAKHACDFPDCDYRAIYFSQLMTHKRRAHTQDVFACGYPDCDEVFLNALERNEHQERHGVVQPRHCPHCSFVCGSALNMQYHLWEHGSCDEPPPPGAAAPPPASPLSAAPASSPAAVHAAPSSPAPSSPAPSPFHCPVPKCRVSLRRRHELVRHMQKAHGVGTDASEDYFDEALNYRPPSNHPSAHRRFLEDNFGKYDQFGNLTLNLGDAEAPPAEQHVECPRDGCAFRCADESLLSLHERVAHAAS